MDNFFKEQVARATEVAVKEKKLYTNASLAQRAGLNAAFITHVMQRKFDNYSNGAAIPAHVFNTLAKVLGVGVTTAETDSYKAIQGFLMYCREHSLPGVIDGPAGSGKTYTIDQYLTANPQGVYKITCARDMTPKALTRALAQVVGVDDSDTQYEVRKLVQLELATFERPLLIIDEAENLSDFSYQTVKGIYDSLEGRAAIILVGANDYWQTLIAKSRRKITTKSGCFPQIVSRWRANICTVPRLSIADVAAAGQLYGVTDKPTISKLYSEVADMRDLFGRLKNRARLEAAGV